MADFNKAISVVLEHEGKYANRKDDRGGETYCGIARNMHPNWGGWHTVDAYKKIKTFPDILDSDIKLSELVIDFYFNEFWIKTNACAIVDQDIATKFLDMSVLIGIYHAAVCLQRALFSCGLFTAKDKIDGVAGLKTLAATNKADSAILLPSLRSEFAGYLRCLNDPDDENGWVKRAYS